MELSVSDEKFKEDMSRTGKAIQKNVGMKRNFLTVISFDSIRNRRPHYLCECDCGNKLIVNIHSVKHGHTKSCGCKKVELCTKSGSNKKSHLMRYTKLYSILMGMKARCFKRTHKNYNLYGGRGITICPEWMDIKKFSEWAHANGYDESLTIERINNNGNYCPENCRWATRKEQAQNTSTCVYIEYNGEKLNMTQWSMKIFNKPRVVDRRIRNGWDKIKAITTPL